MPTTPTLCVHYLPQFVRESDLAAATVVVIDLLRASTTVCHALAAGARDVVPFEEVDAVLAAAKDYPPGTVLLGGERRGLRIEGFDIGNAPSDYTPELVGGKRLLFTTTNGTRAIAHARLATRVVMGCAANASAIGAAVGNEPRLHLVCAGTNGRVSRDDQLAAGLLVDRLQATGAYTLNAEAQAVWGEWQELATAARAHRRTPSAQLARELRETQGGKNLLDIEHDIDLVVSADIDSVPVVPELDRSMGCLRLM